MHKKCMMMKFFHLIHSVLENHEALGLSDEEVKKIRDLKIKTKKDIIKSTAEIDLLAVDIMARLWEEKPDSTEINKLIEKKYDLKKEGMKQFIQAFLALKKSLSKDQMKQLKRICRAEKAREEPEKECCR